MSNALAIASVTAVLKNLLENGLVNDGIITSIGSEVPVTALPPDRITTGGDERAQLNLFLYQTVPNSGLRHADRSSVAAARRADRAPLLALDLHYLVTAYGATDFQIEILLGYTLQLFQRMATLDQALIRQSLEALSSTREGQVLSPPVAALASSRLYRQVEQIKLSSQFLTTEEMSKLWSAMQARYRPSAAYKASVVVLEPAV